jgi:hypothetical protein
LNNGASFKGAAALGSLAFGLPKSPKNPPFDFSFLFCPGGNGGNKSSANYSPLFLFAISSLKYKKLSFLQSLLA